MKGNGSVTTIVALMWAYRAKDVIYSYNYWFLPTAMYLMSTKLHYFHRISLFRGGILLTEKSDVVYQIPWVSTS